MATLVKKIFCNKSPCEIFFYLEVCDSFLAFLTKFVIEMGLFLRDQLGSIIQQLYSKHNWQFIFKKKKEKIPYYYPISTQSSRQLENTLVKELNLLHGQTLPTLERGPICKYFPTAGLYFHN